MDFQKYTLDTDSNKLLTFKFDKLLFSKLIIIFLFNMHGLVYVKICVSVQTRVTGNSNTLIKMAESLQNLKDSFIF